MLAVGAEGDVADPIGVAGKRLELQARVDESDVGGVAPGAHVVFTVDAYPRREFTGTVRLVRLQPQTVQNVVTYTTVIDVPNPGGELRPGMTSTVSIELARADAALRVPAAALRFQPSDEVLKHYPAAAAPPTDDRRRAGTPVVFQGKELSFTNLLDLDAAARIVLEFDRAREADALAAFGGIIGLNRPIDVDTAKAIVSTFIEAVVAPSVDEAARPILATKSTLRVLAADFGSLGQAAR